MTYRVLPLLLTTCLTLAALPATAQDTGALIDRMNRMERDLNNVQRQVYRGGAKGGEGAPIGANAANLEVQLTAMQEQMQSLNGRIETLEHQLNQANKRLEQISKDNEFRFQELEKKVNQPATLPPQAVTEPEAAPRAGTPPRPNTGEEAQAGSDPEDEPAGDTTQPLRVKEEPKPDASGKFHFNNPVDQYNHAFKMLNQAKFDDARSLLSDFVKKYPADPLIGNAYYWLGEVYYVKRDYDSAASNFRLGYEKLPSGPKAADNLLKLGMSLANQGQNDKACVVLKSVQAKFPKASDNVKKTTATELKRAGC